MTLDKIYMPNELLSEEWQRHIQGEDTDYIRKDAILEWAKAYKEEADASARGRTDNPSWGESVALKALIDFINSL